MWSYCLVACKNACGHAVLLLVRMPVVMLSCHLFPLLLCPAMEHLNACNAVSLSVSQVTMIPWHRQCETWNYMPSYRVSD